MAAKSSTFSACSKKQITHVLLLILCSVNPDILHWITLSTILFFYLSPFEEFYFLLVTMFLPILFPAATVSYFQLTSFDKLAVLLGHSKQHEQVWLPGAESQVCQQSKTLCLQKNIRRPDGQLHTTRVETEYRRYSTDKSLMVVHRINSVHLSSSSTAARMDLAPKCYLAT